LDTVLSTTSLVLLKSSHSNVHLVEHSFINLVLTSAAVDKLEPVTSPVSSSVNVADDTLTVGHLPGIARLLDLEVLVPLHNLTLVLTCNNSISEGRNEWNLHK